MIIKGELQLKAVKMLNTTSQK